MSSRICLTLLLKCLFLVSCVGGARLSETGLFVVLTADKELELGEREKNVSPRPGDGQYEVLGKIYDTMDDSLGYLEIGIASWYGSKFHGRLTAMGEVYDMYAMTAAHKALPLPTAVRVTNLDNGISVLMRVNDRGPFHEDRLIDLSYGGARALGFEKQGTAPVVVEAIDEINYPELAEHISQESYYLQVGAFTRRAGAESQMTKVRNALSADVKVRILMSENAEGLLHKVWIGPVSSIKQENVISERIQDQNLGKPVRVIINSE